MRGEKRLGIREGKEDILCFLFGDKKVRETYVLVDGTKLKQFFLSFLVFIWVDHSPQDTVYNDDIGDHELEHDLADWKESILPSLQHHHVRSFRNGNE